MTQYLKRIGTIPLGGPIDGATVAHLLDAFALAEREGAATFYIGTSRYPEGQVVPADDVYKQTLAEPEAGDHGIYISVRSDH